MRNLLLATALFFPSLVRAQTLIYNSSSSPMQETLEDLANQIQQNKAAVNNILLSTSGAAGLFSNNVFTGTNTFTVPTVPIFISSQDVVSVATVTFAIPSSSTSYRFDFAMVSTATYNPRLTFANDTTAVYAEGGTGYTNSQVNFAFSNGAANRACDMVNPTEQITANGSIDGSFYFNYPNYGSGKNTAHGYFQTHTDAFNSEVAGYFFAGCYYGGSSTPSTLKVTFAQTNVLTNPAANNNLIKGHFELWQIGSTHP